MADTRSIFSNDHPFKIIFMAVSVCLVASVLVSAAAIGLRPYKAANERLAKQANVLQVAGLDAEPDEIGAVFERRIEPRVVDLRSGRFTDVIDPAGYDERLAERDPALSEAVPADALLAEGAAQGQNSWPRTGYGGPCPPSGTHRYFFKLYALDSVLDLEPGAADKAALLAAMEGHVIAETELMGRYARK